MATQDNTFSITIDNFEGLAPAYSQNPTTLQGYASDNTGTSQDPKLVVTYTLPSAFIPRTMWFN